MPGLPLEAASEANSAVRDVFVQRSVERHERLLCRMIEVNGIFNETWVVALGRKTALRVFERCRDADGGSYAQKYGSGIDRK